jgi:hypothetical protein
MKMEAAIFEHKLQEVTGGKRKLHNEPHNLYTSPNITRVAKSGRIRWVEHIASTINEHKP